MNLPLLFLICAVSLNAFGQISTNNLKAASPPATNETTTLPEVVVTGRQDSLLGAASSASQGTVGADEIAARPILRSGEILETIPGVIITQHAGGGKANQYFLRGFNLDHGTDFATYLDDMPLNLPSHAHGEGYSDMNSVIPELIERVDYQKGPYEAAVGNYGSAGSAHLVFFQTLPQNFVTVEAGSYGFERGVFGFSEAVGPGHLLFAGEGYHDDGPWVHPDDYLKLNGLATYSQGNDSNGFSFSGRAYHGKWNSSDQIAENAVPLVGYYGALDPTDGGESQRYSLQAEWHHHDENTETKLTVYGFYYYLNLFSDFTYYLTDPALGDQFEQQDNRWVGGLDLRHSIYSEWFGKETENSFGLQVRNDWINNGLYQTVDRQRTPKFDVNSGTVLPATVELDHFTDTQAGIYAENRIQWSEKIRSVLAIRGDIDYFDVNSLVTPANSGTSATMLPSPKGGVTFGPWAKTELYAQGGFGFHSNDGRGATQNVEPVSADNPFPNAAVSRIPGLIQTRGAEIGARTLALPHLQSTFSLWYLYSDSELQQDGDTGTTVASKEHSNRYGIEWANYYTPMEHLALDFDIAESTARFTSTDTADAAPGSVGGTRVPEAVGAVISSGVSLLNWNKLTASFRLRYFGPRDLTSDGAYRSDSTLLFNAQASYQVSRHLKFFAEFLNLLDSRDHDIDYAYTSQITPASKPAFTEVFHPVEPFQFRLGATLLF